ncbi:MAG: hypothetical protein NTX50_27905, partial [Candidatus Sumerlaeota bacterium]|nr:hypothetical protein [Candidatus Sumerlaeota bacterium]
MRPQFFHVFFALAVAIPTGAFVHSAPWLDPAAPDVKTILCSEDNQFSCYEGPGKQTEWLLNFGGAPQTRLKGAQDISAFKFDLAAFRGQTVTEAELHLAKGDNIPIFAMVAATINASWSEGRGVGKPAAPGESCWRWRAMPADPKNPGPDAEWLFPHSDFSMATFGNYGSLVSYGYKASGTFDIYSKGGATWMRMRLDPALIHALILDQYGLAVTDPRGYNHTNPRVFTKDQNKSVCPRLLLRFTPQKDSTPPGAIAGLRAEGGPLDGEVLLSFTAPEDPQAETKRAFGYAVRMGSANDFNAATDAPRWRIPRPAGPGATQRMLFEGLKPGGAYSFFIRAYDAAGNMGTVVSASFTLPVRPAPALSDGDRKAPSASSQSAPTVPSILRYWACSEVAKINPATGNRIEDGSAGSDGDAYKKANAVWDAAANAINLAAARNEMVGCQIILEKLGAALTNIQINPGDLEGAPSSEKNPPTGPSRDSSATDRAGRIPANPNAECFLIHYVADKNARYPDAAIPLSAPFPTSFSIPDPNHNPSGTNQAVWVDWYIPRDAAPGEYQGEIIITAAELPSPAKVKVSLRVHPITIPDALSFVIDLNGYGSKWDYGNMKLNRLRWFQGCQKHRMSLNTLPYGWNAKVASDRAPQVSGSGANVKLNDWSALDADYGPFFDGSAFTSKTPGSPYIGPGAGTPVATFYTPFFESWPVPVLDPQCG